MPAGDQQLPNVARQQRAIGGVVVAAAGDAVGEVALSPHHVVLGHHIDAVQQPRLAHPDLRRHIDDERLLEAR